MIETERLILRPWRETDGEPFWAISQNADVSRYLRPYSQEECHSAHLRMNSMQAEHGHCFWAVEHKADGRFIGFCGIVPPREPTWEYELGWLLERASWGKGYAQEAAHACIDWAWDRLSAATLAAITSAANSRCRRLMHALGMNYDPAADFDDNNMPEGDPRRRQVLYRIERPQ
jgi:RimJ/RimL family protein N-acetyltransferase